MNRVFVLAIWLGYFVPLYGQHWECRTVDASTGAPIAYANIGIIGKDIGTVSDESGKFQLSGLLPKFAGDTLRCSTLGYCHTDLVLAAGMEMPDELRLQPCAAILPEVQVVAANFKKQKRLGHSSSSKKIVFYFMSNKLGTELASKIEVKKGPVSVVQAQFNIAENKFEEVLFRINIYDIDPKTNLPGNKILKEEVIVKANRNSETMAVDLRPYNIVVERDFVLSLEWIKALNGGKITEDLKFCAALSSKRNVFIKKTSQSAWKAFDDKKMGLHAGVCFSVDVKY